MTTTQAPSCVSAKAEELRAQWQGELREVARYLMRPLVRDTSIARPGRRMEVVGFRGRREIVRTGTLDENTRRVFREGQCHALALAGWEATRWPVVWAGEMKGHYPEPDHVLLLTPSGSLLDADGLHDIEAVQDAWGGHVGTVNRTIMSAYILAEWSRPAMGFARAALPLLLDEQGLASAYATPPEPTRRTTVGLNLV